MEAGEQRGDPRLTDNASVRGMVHARWPTTRRRERFSHMKKQPSESMEKPISSSNWRCAAPVKASFPDATAVIGTDVCTVDVAGKDEQVVVSAIWQPVTVTVSVSELPSAGA